KSKDNQSGLSSTGAQPGTSSPGDPNASQILSALESLISLIPQLMTSNISDTAGGGQSAMSVAAQSASTDVQTFVDGLVTGLCDAIATLAGALADALTAAGSGINIPFISALWSWITGGDSFSFLDLALLIAAVMVHVVYGLIQAGADW